MSADKLSVATIAKCTVPLGGQEIELQQLDFAAGGMSLLRTRIREGRRFTVFDIDPVTARRWGEALLAWVATQPGAGLEDAAGVSPPPEAGVSSHPGAATAPPA